MNNDEFIFAMNLYDFYERREQALGFTEPSPFLQSMQSAIVLEASKTFVSAAQRMDEAQKLHELIQKNSEKIAKLSKRIESSKSEKRIRTWYTVVLKLYEEADEAQKKLEAMSDGE